MGTRKQHCEDCLQKMGKEWNEVHAWLDGLSSPKRGYLNVNHRRYRHHREGVEEVRKMWGDEAAKAAEFHLIMDFGRVPERWEVEERFPEKEELISFKSLNGG